MKIQGGKASMSLCSEMATELIKRLTDIYLYRRFENIGHNDS